MNDTIIAVDINHTPVEELCRVPGIGMALAERVITNRPYESIDDMLRVPGIGDRFLDRIRPYVCVSAPVGIELSPDEAAAALFEKEAGQPITANPPGEAVDIFLAPLPDEADLEAPESVDSSPTILPVSDSEPLPPTLNRIEPPASAAITGSVETLPAPFETEVTAAPTAEPAPAAEPKAGPSIESRPSRLEVLAYVLLGGFLALVIGVLVTLGILRTINGDLIYTTASRFNGLQAEVGAVSGQISALQQESAGMLARLEALETLGGRVSAVEREAQTLRTDLAAADREIQALQAQTEELAAQTEELAAQTEQLAIQTAELQQRSRIFQNFLDGLRELLVGLPVAETK